MARYPDAEIEPDSTLATRAKADRLVVATRFEAGEGTRAILTYTARSSVSPDPDIPDPVFANAAHLVLITARPGLLVR